MLEVKQEQQAPRERENVEKALKMWEKERQERENAERALTKM